MRDIGKELLYDCVRIIQWIIVKLFGLIGSAFRFFINRQQERKDNDNEEHS